MKNKVKTIFGATAAAMLLSMTTSCVNDLDVENINPKQTTTLDTEALLNKIYASFVLTGQQGPAGNGDIKDADEGRSEFYRMVWNLNELTTDEAHWIWYTNDTGYEDLVENTYGADNAVASGLYYRIYFTITLCNQFLKEVADDGTAETKARRAEARFIRAYNYYMIMDLYGNAVFTETVSTEPGQYYTRKQFFNYVEQELLAVEQDLMAPESLSYGRISNVAAWMMLSRLYLNARVYLGLADDAAASEYYTKAKTYADKVITGQTYFKLCEKGATNPQTGEVYSAYQMLFLADNNENGAQQEMIIPVIHDGVNTTSYGGMHSLVLASYSAAMSEKVPSGTSNSWGKCNRLMGKLSDIFFGSTDVTGLTAIADVVKAANDDRALIYPGSYKRNIVNEDDADAGYACVKFRNVRSDGKATSTTNAFVDTDLPLMRVAEAYLNYAEADARLNGGVTTKDGADKLNVLLNRANVPATQQSTSYGLNELRNQWAKEFWFEGRRRMDLVRFNSYGGQSDYKWEWMGNAASGQKFAATRNIFGIPYADITNNPNLEGHQNEGY
ncbi:MAG: RagB/SusD family nutrient uptake outer membrane protein [Prevotella sp.]|jgi:hypothetical protein|nr:RagB/SusD family nutrient uptake outer membrane protein [Prevotella sp.]